MQPDKLKPYSILVSILFKVERFMKKTMVEGSSIYAIQYEPDNLILEIEFRDRHVETFNNFPPAIYYQLLNSVSKDRYYTSYIKGIFTDSKKRTVLGFIVSKAKHLVKAEANKDVFLRKHA